MLITQLPTADTSGTALVWRLIESLNETAKHVSPTNSSGGDGYSMALQTLVVLLALLVLAVFALSGAILWIFGKWRADQRAGIEALSKSKDTTKREITQLLKDELGNARAANASDFKELREIVKQHGDALNTVRVDLALIGQKVKIPIISATKQPAKDGNSSLYGTDT